MQSLCTGVTAFLEEKNGVSPRKYGFLQKKNNQTKKEKKKRLVGNVTNKDVKHALVVFVGSLVLFLLPCIFLIYSGAWLQPCCLHDTQESQTEQCYLILGYVYIGHS